MWIGSSVSHAPLLIPLSSLSRSPFATSTFWYLRISSSAMNLRTTSYASNATATYDEQSHLPQLQAVTLCLSEAMERTAIGFQESGLQYMHAPDTEAQLATRLQSAAIPLQVLSTQLRGLQPSIAANITANIVPFIQALRKAMEGATIGPGREVQSARAALITALEAFQGTQHGVTEVNQKGGENNGECHVAERGIKMEDHEPSFVLNRHLAQNWESEPGGGEGVIGVCRLPPGSSPQP